MKKFLCLILCGLLCFPSGMTGKKKGHYEPLFGKKYASYAVTSSSLKGATFYLVSGHGGPDPGCIGKYRGKELHEDEYAYDIILRLGRELMKRGAKVHFIISCVIGTLNVSMSNIIVSQGASKTSASAMRAAAVPKD